MNPGGWSSILSKIRQEPRLSREEERELLARTQSGDATAEHKLVVSHLRFVLHVAHRYKRFGVPVSELLQEGTVGLMEAVRRFNPEIGVRLSTYAAWWIRVSIQDYVVRSRSMVRIGASAAQRGMFFALWRRVGEIAEADGRAEEMARSLATKFNTSVGDVIGFARRIGKSDQSLNAPTGDDRAESWLDRIADDAPSPEETVSLAHDLSLRLKALAAALRNLPPRERHIIRCRFLSEPAPSRAALGAQLGLSKERVRQLELRALTRLKGILQPVY